MVVAAPACEAQSVPTRAARLYGAGTVIVAIITCLCIVSTYSIFTQTTDEPGHIACGMEWLDRGVYQYQPEQPPLSRIAAAVGPYVLGERSHGAAESNAEGNLILSSSPQYQRTLAFARFGELPFTVLALAGVWVWARRYFGPPAAFFSALSFSLLPPILAHGGLATTDIAVTAGCTWALYAFTRFLDERTWKTSIALGCWCGIALLSKFSAIAFLATGFLALSLAYVFCFVGAKRARQRMKLTRALPLALAVSFLLIWSCYRFSVQPLFGMGEPRVKESHLSQALFRPGPVRTFLTTVPVPADRFFVGIGDVFHHNRIGHWSYLLGEIRKTGWWYFFPVVLGIKTPLGFLAVALAGGGALLMGLRRHGWQPAASVLAALSILLVCMSSRIDLGVRHILPIYPLLSVGAGYFIADSIKRLRSFRSVFALSCLLWCAADSLMAHPDYLAWFNPIASSHPEKFLVDSNLDWGQDLGRLSKRLQELHVPSITIAYFGAADPSHFGLPPVHEVPCDDLPSGYAAISISMIYLGKPFLTTCPDRLDKYEHIKPAETVGKSIFLYYFPPHSEAPCGAAAGPLCLKRTEQTPGTARDKNSF